MSAVIKEYPIHDAEPTIRSVGRPGLVIEELNYNRKAHRVNIPLVVEIEGTQYRAFDWSVDGVGITDADLSLEVGAKVPARCILPMPDAQVAVQVTLDFRGTHGAVDGFRFVDIPANVRRLLRHYIELAVGGQLTNIEDLVSVVTTPGVASPIRDPLNLTDLEREGVLRHFKQKSAVSITVGVLFLLTVIGVLFYNTTYRIAATGLVSGNLEQVTANTNGVLDQLLVTTGVPLTVGTPLFVVRNPDDEQRLVALGKMVDGIALQLEQVRRRGEAMLKVALQPAQALLEQRKTEFDRGQALYDQKILPFRDFTLMQHQYQADKLELVRERARLEADQQFRISELEQRRRNLQIEKEGLLQRMEAAAIHSKVNGRVMHIEYQEGNYVTRNDPVVLIETDTRPFVLAKLLSRDALKIRMGMPADVYVPETGGNYQATVTAVGYAAADSRATVTMEASLNETVVRLELADHGVRLPANSRVRVWIRTF